jgi:hypothetical protein
MSNALETRLKAEGIALAIQTATGKTPVVRYYPDNHAEIFFNAADVKFLQAYTEKLLSAKAKTDIRLNAMPVLIPSLLKRAAPYLIGLIALGYLLRAGTVK